MHLRSKYIVLTLVVFILAGLSYSPAFADEPVTLYGVFETKVTNDKRYLNPFDFQEIELLTEFQSPSGRIIPFTGFYDGDGEGRQDGNVWKMRFMPDETGLWTYRYSWTDGSPGGSGRFNVVDTGLPGPLRVDPDYPWFFETARGRPFHWRGYDVRYLPPGQNHVAWRGGAAENYIKIIKEHVLPKRYNFIMLNSPSWAQHAEADHEFGSWWYHSQTDRFDVVVWAKYEQILRTGLENRVYIMPFDGAVSQSSGNYITRKLLRYQAARLGAYASYLGYSLTWEYYDIYTDEQVNEWMTFLRDSLPESHRPLLTVHDHARSSFRGWQDFHMRQGADNGVRDDILQANNRSLDVDESLLPYNQPIIGSEGLWESPGERGERLRYPATAEQVRRTAWGKMMAGVMPLYSEWTYFLFHDMPERLGKGEGEPEVRRMFDFFYSQTNYRRYRQLNHLVAKESQRIASGIPGEEYLVFAVGGEYLSLNLSDTALTQAFSVLWYDPKNGRMRNLGVLYGGDIRRLRSPFKGDSVLLLKAAPVDEMPSRDHRISQAGPIIFELASAQNIFSRERIG